MNSDTGKEMGYINPELKELLKNQDKEEAKHLEKLFSTIEEEHKKEPFTWMRSWLEAYAKENDIDVDKIMNWILEQPSVVIWGLIYTAILKRERKRLNALWERRGDERMVRNIHYTTDLCSLRIDWCSYYE